MISWLFRSSELGQQKETRSASDILDCSEALASTGGDAGFLAELAGIFEAACPALLGRIQHAIAAADFTDAARAAHLLGVVAQNVTAKRVARAAFDLEALARQNSADRAQAAHEVLLQEIVRLKPLLPDLQSQVARRESLRRRSEPQPSLNGSA